MFLILAIFLAAVIGILIFFCIVAPIAACILSSQISQERGEQ